MDDLFSDERERLVLDPGAMLLGGFALPVDRSLLDAVADVAAAAPFRRLETPGGRLMSVAMTNACRLGWVSDRRGYRYDPVYPLSGIAWPAMPAAFATLAHDAAAAAGFPDFTPDACLINRYAPARSCRSIRIATSATSASRSSRSRWVSRRGSLWGGATRSGRVRRIGLHHGDVVVWGGPARLAFHGIDTLATSAHPLTGMLRYNLTFRRAA